MSERPKAFQICTNEACERFDNETEVEITSFGYALSFCQLCHSKAAVVVRHHGKEFPSYGEFETYAAGLSREYKLLKRLIVAGLADTKERAQGEDAELFLEGLRCSCCNQPFLPKETDGEMKPDNAEQGVDPNA